MVWLTSIWSVLKSEYDPVWRAWRNMMDRCYNTDHKYYNDYGGRGIIVDSRWHDFENFQQDMGVRPDGYSLDRIDNDAPYSSSNCRWTTMTNQIRNRRNTLKFSLYGETKTLFEWSIDSRCNVPYNTLHHRIKAGWSIRDALTRPKRNYVRN